MQVLPSASENTVRAWVRVATRTHAVEAELSPQQEASGSLAALRKGRPSETDTDDALRTK